MRIKSMFFFLFFSFNLSFKFTFIKKYNKEDHISNSCSIWETLLLSKANKFLEENL